MDLHEVLYGFVNSDPIDCNSLLIDSLSYLVRKLNVSHNLQIDLTEKFEYDCK